MRTIAVANQKGGCGKTITAINLSAFLALEHRRVLLVDMDPQGHATLGLLTDAVQPSQTIYDVLVRQDGGRATRLRDVVRSVFDGLDLAPADLLLSTAPERLATTPDRETILSRAFDEVQDRYDYVVVDCPPNVGLLTFNALMACSEAIVPMDPSFFSLHGLGKLLETFDMLATRTGHQIAARVLVTLYDGRSRFAKDVVDEMRTHLQGRHFDTLIRHSVKLAEAASHGLPIARYQERCVGFLDYRALAGEVLQQEAAMLEARRAAPGEPAIPVGASDDREGSPPSMPRLTPEGVRFSILAPDAGRVQLVGDFNEWTLEGSEMTLMAGVWRKVLKLGPGRYRYRYVVDGYWLSDPLNDAVEPSPYGGHNSVVVLGEEHGQSGSVHAD